MARRKSHKRKSTHRRRRSHMGATGGTMTTMLSMVAGAVAGRILQSKLSSKVDPKILAVGQIAVGLVLPRFVKNKFVAGIGTGMVINGGVTALSQFGVISAVAGIGAADYALDYVSGTDNLSVLAGDDEMGFMDEGTFSGTDNLSVIAGDYEDLSSNSDY